MRLLCRLLGHRRSRSHAVFDERSQRWLSDCRWCGLVLIREPDGAWHPAPPVPDKLLPAGADSSNIHDVAERPSGTEG